MKELRCSHFYADCEAVVRGETVEALMEEAARHGREAHGEDPSQWTEEEIAEMHAHIRDVG